MGDFLQVFFFFPVVYGFWFLASEEIIGLYEYSPPHFPIFLEALIVKIQETLWKAI